MVVYGRKEHVDVLALNFGDLFAYALAKTRNLRCSSRAKTSP